MAKNKQKGKKHQNVFQVATKQSKPKSKTKPVKTSLKHINTLKKEKVENLNQIFSEVQRDMKSISKSTAKESTGKASMSKDKLQESVNVDGATQLLSQL
ncbi:hypothetical protein Q7C36_007134 [Tachysurus vachellii]|uniref:Uncharacterized protein n=1 Tax=Tachysurus vachellii TaxID=175792 RepID=A0AA88NGR8_TACVA|nr:ribosomal biogenesis factor [Tachysurus vachellii]KAK2855265.1 hypothetical protein Q7C36_007134 [Tachysurus vachellii]